MTDTAIRSDRRGIALLPAVAATFLASFPILRVYSRATIEDLTPDFVSYRIGDALWILSGGADVITPVQGLPTALLSKIIVIALGQDISRAAVQLYCQIFAACIVLAVAVTILASWRLLSTRSALAVSLVACGPWWMGGPSIGLLIAPDYWMGEWAWMVAAVAVAAALLERERPAGPWPYAIAGLTIGLGCSEKISLLGAAPILLLSVVGSRGWSRWPAGLAVATLAAASAYLAILLIYMGSLADFWGTLAFQLRFFGAPNQSRQFADAWQALAFEPLLPWLLAAFLLIAAAAASRRRQPILQLVLFCVVAWAAGYGYLLHSRPHQSSLTSLVVSIYGMLAFLTVFVPGRRGLSNLSGAILILLIGASFLGWPVPRTWASWSGGAVDHDPRLRAALDRIDRYSRKVWFMPDFSWNANLPVQTFGFGARLGLAPWSVRDGRPVFTAPTSPSFTAAFPGAFIERIVSDGSAQQMSAILRKELGGVIEGGTPIVWTRPAGDPGTVFLSFIRGTGAEPVEFPLVSGALLFGYALPAGTPR